MLEGPGIAFLGYHTGVFTPCTVQFVERGVPGTDYEPDTWPDNQQPSFRVEYTPPPVIPDAYDFRINEVFLAF